jgi:hypothetical protein
VDFDADFFALAALVDFDLAPKILSQPAENSGVAPVRTIGPPIDILSRKELVQLTVARHGRAERRPAGERIHREL